MNRAPAFATMEVGRNMEKLLENSRTVWGLLKETADEWFDDQASELAAALAFYTVFSLAPMLIILIAIASTILGGEAIRQTIISQFSDYVGYKGAKIIAVILEQARQKSNLATAVGLGTLLFGATAVFTELQDALNSIWEIRVKPGNFVKMFFRKRLMSFLMILGIGVLLLASLMVSAGLAAAVAYLGEALPAASYVLELAQFTVSFTVITVLFAAIYKVLPDVKIQWSDVWIGAAVTSLLFTIGKTVIGVYLVRSTVGSAYGAAGSFVILLVWVYYSAQVFFLGAEFTQVYARWRGSPIVPDENAVRFTTAVHDETG